MRSRPQRTRETGVLNGNPGRRNSLAIRVYQAKARVLRHARETVERVQREEA